MKHLTDLHLDVDLNEALNFGMWSAENLKKYQLKLF